MRIPPISRVMRFRVHRFAIIIQIQTVLNETLDKFFHINYISCSPLRRDVRAAEGARLESVCTSKAYRGFKSLSLRHLLPDTILQANMIAGPRATASRKPRQVRKEATVAIPAVCRGQTRLSYSPVIHFETLFMRPQTYQA